MNGTISLQQHAIKARTSAFGNFIDPERQLVDLPNMVLVELDVPEYARNGLGRMLGRTLRYEFIDLGQFGCEALSIGADSSASHMVYADMNPTIVGTFEDAYARAPGLAKALMARRYGSEMVALGTLRGVEMGIDAGSDAEVERLTAYLEKYHRRASWMEAHQMEVRMANMDALVGNPAPFDWARLFPSIESGEL